MAFEAFDASTFSEGEGAADESAEAGGVHVSGEWLVIFFCKGRERAEGKSVDFREGVFGLKYFNVKSGGICGHFI